MILTSEKVEMWKPFNICSDVQNFSCPIFMGEGFRCPCPNRGSSASPLHRICAARSSTTSTRAKLSDRSILFHFSTRRPIFSLADTQVVVLAQNVQVSPLFHQRARLIFPLLLRVRLVHVGTSSYSLDIDLIDREFGDVLITARRIFAAMDPNTGQAKPLPESFR